MKFQHLVILLIGFTFFASCKNDKTTDATIGSAKTEASKSANSITYNLKAGEGKVMWTGSKPAGKHSGFINVSSGELAIENNKVTSGSITLDMNSITCTDLDGDSKANLEAHLKGSKDKGKDDFFNVSQFPNATFVITKITEIKNDPQSNSLVYGNLTLKGATKEIGFKANISHDQNGLNVKSNDFSLNRTDWGIKYKSKNFIEGLKDKFIDDEIVLSIAISSKN